MTEMNPRRSATSGHLTDMPCGCTFDTPWEGQTVWNSHVQICSLHADYPDFVDFKAALRTELEPASADVLRRFNERFFDEMRAGYRTLGDRVPTRGSLLLTTTGAKSGKPRTSPVSFQRTGSTFVVIATSGGRDRNPDWYHNIVADSSVRIEAANHVFGARAREATGADREHLIAVSVLARPTHASMFERATRLPRRIPIIAITPIVDDLPYNDTLFDDQPYH